MIDFESGGSQQELQSAERPKRKKKRNTDLDIDIRSNRNSTHKIRQSVRSSRERLSFDHVHGNNDLNKQVPLENGTDVRQEINNQRSKKQRIKPHRLPRSVSEEVLALEGRFNPQPSIEREESMQKRIQKVKDRSEKGTGSFDLPPSGRKTNRSENRRKKKNAILEPGNEEQYQGDVDEEVTDFFPLDKEDIIQPTELNQSNSRIYTVMGPSALPSQPMDVVYIEKKDGQGFLRENKNRMHRLSQGRNDYAIKFLQEQKQQTTLDFMLTTHLFIQSLALIGHGLLAGIAVSQCVFVYSLERKSGDNLLQNYRDLAMPFQSVYYFLLAFSTMSILDRYMNISSGWGPFFLRLLQRPSRALALVAYFFALIFSVSLAQLDDKISLYDDGTAGFVKDPAFYQLGTWKIINLMRVVGSFLGWIMVAIAPSDDQTAEMLKEGTRKESQDFQMTSVQTSAANTWDRVNNIHM